MLEQLEKRQVDGEQESDAAEQAPGKAGLLGGDVGLELGLGLGDARIECGDVGFELGAQLGNVGFELGLDFGDARIERGDVGFELDAQLGDVVLGGDVLAEPALDGSDDGLGGRRVEAGILKVLEGFVGVEQHGGHRGDEGAESRWASVGRLVRGGGVVFGHVLTPCFAEDANESRSELRTVASVAQTFRGRLRVEWRIGRADAESFAHGGDEGFGLRIGDAGIAKAFERFVGVEWKGAHARNDAPRRSWSSIRKRIVSSAAIAGKGVRNWGIAALIGGGALVNAPVVFAQGAEPTPEATAFNVVRDTDTELLYGFAAPLPGQSERLGMYVLCERAGGGLRAGMFFGVFPAGKPVQAAVRAGDGTVERFGPVLVGSPASGFHDPLVEERLDVLRLVGAAFTEGALLSNGHNSVWNRVPESENRRARAAIERCARE